MTEKIFRSIILTAVIVLIGCFIAGAALGAFLTGPAPQRAVLGAAALQSAAFVLMWGRDASPA